MGDKRSLNRVILIGNVGQDPELRHIPSLDKTVAKFSLATTETYVDKDNNFQDVTEWHNIVVWGKWQVQKVEKNVTKGSLLLIEGKIKTSKWQDKESNATRSRTEIQAQNVIPLRRPEGEGGTGGRTAGATPGKGKSEEDAPPSYDVDSDIPYDESDPF
jgi:single-strand DNA-binding protein